MAKTKNLNSVTLSRLPRKDILLKDMDATEVEAFKTIRTSIFFSLVQVEGCKKLLFTSSVSKEGKSTVVVNLAITVSMTNAKVLLIDCDLRKPRMHRFFKDKNIPGLSNYLLGENDLDSIIKKTEIPNLHVIYAGAIPPNPVELLDSKVFQEMMDTLSQSYEYIFIDCPPLLEVTDALVVSKLCSGTVLVARQKYTTHRFIHQALKKLDFANAKVLGFVLNDVPKKKNKYYYRYIT